MAFIERMFRALFGWMPKRKPEALSPRAFTEIFAQILRKRFPERKLEIVQDLELKFDNTGDGPVATFLNNFYDEYRLDPTQLDAVVQRYIASLSDDNLNSATDQSRIVPIIKDRAWVSEVSHSLIDRKYNKPPEMIFEVYNTELVIAYAEDLPNTLRYLNHDTLQKLNIPRQDLRKLACENLMRILPDIRLHGGDGFYMVTAGGNFEASLLVLNSFWNGDTLKVEGEIVVAIPTRDVLLVTGSNRKVHLQTLREGTKRAFENGAYRLTQKLFVYRDGQFVEFNDFAERLMR